MKKLAIICCASVLSVGALSNVFADEDDAKWVSKCVSDNQSEGQSVETLTKYCTCMNNKMSTSETQSITDWEKSHPQENEACSKAAGWVGQ